MISRYEGGYGWSKNDAGGPTRFGITCYDLAQHRHQKMDSMKRWAPIVRAMPLSEADDIYAAKYATACRFNELNDGVDCVVFDFGVNSGPSRSIRYAQRLVGVNADGVLGPATLHAINDMPPKQFINRFCDARMSFLRGLGNWGSFGKGWSSRVKDLRSYALALAAAKQAKFDLEEKQTLLANAHVKAYADENLHTGEIS